MGDVFEIRASHPHPDIVKNVISMLSEQQRISLHKPTLEEQRYIDMKELGTVEVVRNH